MVFDIRNGFNASQTRYYTRRLCAALRLVMLYVEALRARLRGGTKQNGGKTTHKVTNSARLMKIVEHKIYLTEREIEIKEKRIYKTVQNRLTENASTN